MTYFDFDIALETDTSGACSVHVLHSPCGEARATFEPPLSQLELENFRLRLARSGRAVRSVRQQDVGTIRDYGARLYEALITGAVENCFRASLAQVRNDDATAGLRIRLRLRDAGELAALPWEYMYQPSSRTYLALRDDTPLVRYLELGQAVRPLRLAAPLRVLVVIASPANLDTLEAEDEWQRLQQSLSALQEQGLVLLHRLPRATIRELRWELKRNDYHVFHFIGHGGVAADGSGVLFFEDDERQAVEFTAERLGVLLREEKTLRLAVLNACEGGAAPADDIFSGTAQSLIHQEIPAVVAMQSEISDESAITFSHEFYQALAHGDPIDSAVTWARRAMFTQGDEVEWGTPVLYMRAPDGRLFDVDPADAAARPRRPAPAAVPDPVQPLAGPAPSSLRVEVTRHHPSPTPVTEPQPGYTPPAAWPAYAPPMYPQPEAPRRRWWHSRRKVGAVAAFVAVAVLGLIYVYVPNREQEALRAGYTAVKAWQEAQLKHGDSIAYTLALLPDHDYLVLGSCDRTCDLHIYVEDIARASHASRHPQAQFTTGPEPGRAVVVVKAERCSTEPCYYGWGVYGKPLRN